MDAARTPCSDRVVVHMIEPERAVKLRERARTLGTVEPLEERPDLFVLYLGEPPADPRTAWERVRSALGDGCEVEPVLFDPDGAPHYPTGHIVVRFREAPSDEELEGFAREHGLRLRARNPYVPAQAEFERGDRNRYLLELVEGVERSSGVRSAWPDTLSRYRRG